MSEPVAALLASVALLSATLTLDEGAVSPLFFVVLNVAPVLVGYAIIDQTYRASIAVVYGAAMLAFWAGARLAARSVRTAAPDQALPAGVARQRSIFVLTVVGGLAALHLAIAGIPLLSQNVEVQRYGFSSSGFFGIPGRMYLFGTLFAALYATLANARCGGAIRRVVVAAWAVFVAAQLLSGFKGSVVTIAGAALFAAAASGSPLRIGGRTLGRYGAVAAIAVVYAAVVGTRYQTTHLQGAGSALPYLVKRATVGAADPGFVAIRSMPRTPPTGASSYLADDFRYFALKYTGRGAPADLFPLDQRVSSRITSTPLTPSSFIVPVTVGAVPALVLDFGSWGAVLALAVVGAAFSGLLRVARSTRSAFLATAAGFAAFELFVFIVNGGFAYLVINTLAVAAFIGLVSLGADALFPAPEQARARRRPGARRVALRTAPRLAGARSRIPRPSGHDARRRRQGAAR